MLRHTTTMAMATTVLLLLFWWCCYSELDRREALRGMRLIEKEKGQSRNHRSNTISHDWEANHFRKTNYNLKLVNFELGRLLIPLLCDFVE